MYELVALFAAFIFVYSLVAGGLARTPVSGAIVFTLFGWVIGPTALDLLNFAATAEGLRSLAELTLALVLFTDAANADLAVLRRSIALPQRLLLVGLPLTIALGTGAGVLLFDQLPLLEVVILATMLAPTDAALGAAVISDKRVPANVREGLNVESGLNDGICVPILLILLAFAGETAQETGATQLALSLVAEELGIGIAVGAGLSFLAMLLIRYSDRHAWITDTWRQLPVVALATGSFALSQILGGSGFIAAWVAGLLFGALAKAEKPTLLLAAEGTGQTLGLITWIVFGALILGHVRDVLTWQVFAYAVLSLTLIRMLPIYLVLTRSGLVHSEKLFIGWFGPRGLASIVFAVIVLGENLPNGSLLVQTTVVTVVISIFCHGLSANPLVRRLAARLATRQQP